MMFDPGIPALGTTAECRKITAPHSAAVISFADPDEFVSAVIAVIGPFVAGAVSSDDLADGTAEIVILVKGTGVRHTVTQKLISFEHRLF